MLANAFRFHGHNSLRYVYSHGQAVRSQALTIKWVTNDRRHAPRVSVVVSKKVYKGAVGRNKIRRRLYEYVRTHLDRFNGVYDIALIVTSPELRTLPYAELVVQVDELFVKANLYTQK